MRTSEAAGTGLPTPSRRRLLLNVALGIIVAWFGWVGAHFRVEPAPDGPGRMGGRPGPPFAPVEVSVLVVPFLLLLAAGIGLRWRAPRLAFVAVVVGVGGYFATGESFYPLLVAPALVVYSTAITLPPRRWLGLTVLLLPMFLITGLHEPYLGLLDPGTYAGLLAGLAVVFVPALLGLARRGRRDNERRQREEDRRRYAYEERLRIAREVHDVVGHSLSVVTMQAGVALHVLDKQRTAGGEPPAAVTESLEAIRTTSRDALAELRTTLDVFREPSAGEPRAPRAGLARLEDLVAALRQAGRRIIVDREDDGPTPLPAAVDQAAFRIVQEGLTNVVRHAGEAAATVRVGRDPRRLWVEVTDDGPTEPELSEGNGIRGMRERARAVGGTLSVATRPGGGVRVRAELPLTAAPAEPDPALEAIRP